MDLNYAFDPFAQLARLFKRRRDFTLLVDEAHHALDRVRDSLSGMLDSRELRRFRTDFNKALGRKHPYGKLLSALLLALMAVEPPQSANSQIENDEAISQTDEALGIYVPVVVEKHSKESTEAMPERPAEGSVTTADSGNRDSERSVRVRECRIAEPPEAVVNAAQALCEATFGLLGERLPSAECRQGANRLIRLLAPFLYAAEHFNERYAALLTCHGKERALELFCLSPAETLASVTHGLRGTVFFSATLAPLPAMRALLGGEEEDACFALPSPFPPERLMVVRKRVQTRYAFREESAASIAHSIAEAVNARPGKHIAYFPSYAYLRLVLEHLLELPLPPLLVQENDMAEEARTRFLSAFTQEPGPRLGLCVLGGLFSEGVDLPGDQLIGAMIVGVGLPTPSLRLKTLQTYYEERFGDGFLYAWMIPAMQKVSQAGGRVIRTESDLGLIVLMDDRYYDARYCRLLPPEWQLLDENIAGAARALNLLEGI